MTDEHLQDLASAYVRSCSPFNAQYSSLLAYQAGARMMLEQVHQHMASVVTKDFNKVASVFQLEGLIASNRDHFLKPFQELPPC